MAGKMLLAAAALFVTAVSAQSCSPQPPQGGRYDGVDFTDAQATAVLYLVNKHNADDELRALDVYSSTIRRIGRARPICTMRDLSRVRGVGPWVMRRLKERVSVARDGETCTNVVQCDTGLVCIGLISFGEGTCGASSFAGTFPNTPASLAVPAAGQSASFTFNVNGLATVPVDIVLSMDGSGVSRPQDLKIVLSVQGQSDFVYHNGGSTIPAERSDIGNSRDDVINVPWIVTVTNNGAASGTITGLSLYLTSRFD